MTAALLAAPPVAALRNKLLLVAVAAGFALVQLATMGLIYPLGHDETVYLSHLNPVLPAFPWRPHRALGMPLLVAPVSLTDAPLPAIRLYLVVLSSAALLLAYLAWFAVRDTIVIPVAAALFGSAYVVIYHAGLALPNYYTALGAVAATGLFIHCVKNQGARWAQVGLASAVAATALVRASDSLWLALPLLLLWFGLRAGRRPATAAAIAAGMAIGWGVWAIEAFARFEGPIARMRSASEAVGGGGLHLDFTTAELYVRMWSAIHLECYRGNLPCELTEPVRPATLVWGLVVAGLLGYGVVSAVRRRHTMEVAIPLVVGASLAFSYLFVLRYGALRFVLPSGALLSVPVARGLVDLARLRHPHLRRVGAALAAVAVIGHVGVNQLDMRRLVDIKGPVVTQNALLVEEIRRRGVGTPCVVLGDWVHSIAYQVGCESWGRLRSVPLGEPAGIARARREGAAVVIVLRRPPPERSFLDSWEVVPADNEGHGRWTVYVAPRPSSPSAVGESDWITPSHHVQPSRPAQRPVR